MGFGWKLPVGGPWIGPECTELGGGCAELDGGGGAEVGAGLSGSGFGAAIAKAMKAVVAAALRSMFREIYE